MHSTSKWMSVSALLTDEILVLWGGMNREETFPWST